MSYRKNTEFLFKVLIIGEGGAGKTCLVRRYVHSVFLSANKATIGVDFALKELADPATGRHVTLQLWDIAGQERYGQMTRVYYQAAAAAVIVADITRPETLDMAVKWKVDVDSKVFQGTSTKPIPSILLINKVDLMPNGVLAASAAGVAGNSAGEGGICMTTEEMDAFCREHGFQAWFLTSAKENKNVDAAFQAVVDCLLKTVETSDTGNRDDNKSKILQSNRPKQQERSGCPC